MNHGSPLERAARASLATAIIAASCAMVLVLGAAAAARAEVRVIHQPPARAVPGVELELEAALSGASARGGEVRFRSGAGSWNTLPLHPEGDHWAVRIPAAAVAPPALEYYLRMETEAGDEFTSPAAGPESRPHVIPVGAVPGRLTVVSPAPDAPVPLEPGEILAFFDPPLPSTEGVLVLLDRRDVTDFSDIAPDFILHVPDHPLAPGPHELRVFFVDEAGTTVEERWTFTASAEAAALPPGDGISGAPSAAASPPFESRFSLHGRIEAGWSGVLASSDSADAPLPYPERDGLLVTMSGFGRVASRDLSFGITRNPIYESETRWSARLDGRRTTIEAGDVLPYLSDETLAWFASDGAWGEIRSGRAATRLAFLRTAHAETTPLGATPLGEPMSLASYDQYLLGASQRVAAGPLDATLSAAHTWDDTGSLEALSPGVPSAAFVEPAIRNTVWSLEGGAGHARRLHAALSWSRQRSDGIERRATAYRVGLAQHGPRSDIALEFRSRGPGWLALGAPALNSGEEGLFLDSRWRSAEGPWQFHLHAELYRDYEANQPLEGRTPILQASFNVDSGARRGVWPVLPFFIARYTRVPYASATYASGYASTGADLGRGALSAALSASCTITEYAGTARLWTGNGSLWYRPAGKPMDAKLRVRLDRGTGPGSAEDYTRPGFGMDAGYRARGTEWRASWEWLSRRDHARSGNDYTEHLLALTAGRAF